MVDVYVVNNGYVDLGSKKIKIEELIDRYEKMGCKITYDNHFLVIKH